MKYIPPRVDNVDILDAAVILLAVSSQTSVDRIHIKPRFLR